MTRIYYSIIILIQYIHTYIHIISKHIDNLVCIYVTKMIYIK